MSLTVDDVEKIAALARLELTEAEKKQYQEQLSAVLAYAALLDELSLAEVAPTSSAVTLSNVMRPDLIMPSLATDLALLNANHQAQNQFKIQPVLDE